MRVDYDTYRDSVVLVDRKGAFLGVKDKMQAHKDGDLHSAFSIFIFNSKSELLLQRRAVNKYHSGGLWTNTCCSHPFPQENIIVAGRRRLQEEMGFKCELFEIHTKIYDVKCSNGLIEHEYNKILLGRFDEKPKINEIEVSDWKWMDLEFLQNDIKAQSEKYTSWFPILLDDVVSEWKKTLN